VGLCVRTGEQVRECADALLPVMPRGSVLVVHSTVNPDLIRALAQEGAAHGVDVLDAPVTVTRYGAVEGPFVCAMIGADEQAAERLRPLLDAYATDTVYVGRLGAGMSLKIINNLVSLVQITVAEEAFRLAALSGVPAEALSQVMTRNGALTPTMKVIAARAGAAPADRATLTAREVQARNGLKDLALAEALARSLDTPSAAASFAKGQYWHAYTANLPQLEQ
jgi:3-hydroxyisobutyrate dehydrogenase-like beta-hydroxyacid dehydrogenase